MSLAKDAWDALLQILTFADTVKRLAASVSELSKQVQNLRDENHALRVQLGERVVRVETIIDEARRRGGGSAVSSPAVEDSTPRARIEQQPSRL